jgi:pimeloyl-ACP methyl ester carboxylesterase
MDKLHPESLEDIPEAQEMFSSISPDTIMRQQNLGIRWEATNWNGACDALAKIAKPTLVITGTDDNAYIPHENSLIIAGKIPGGLAYTDRKCRSCSNLTISRKNQQDITNVSSYDLD